MFGPGEYVPDPTEGILTSKASLHPNRHFIAVTISTIPAPDVGISPLATPPISAPCTTLAMYAPVARLTSW